MNDWISIKDDLPNTEDFVPSDEDGNVLEKPPPFKELVEKWNEYQQALDRVIFEGEWIHVSTDSHNTVFIDDGDIIEFFPNKTTVANGKVITRIADLPREITFKDGVV